MTFLLKLSSFVLALAFFSRFPQLCEGRLISAERGTKEFSESLLSLNGEKNEGTCDQIPVSKKAVTFPDNIAGRAKIDFDMYSGYINVTSAPDYLFYWFFGTADGNNEAPLVIWTNGGPGCSAMEGATTENSPLVLFDIKEACSTPDNCDYTGQLSANPYSWNRHANVLYLDQPRYVGYSFGYGDNAKSSVEAADDFVTFYLNWLELFPEFKGRKLIIAGESYGGHYVPAWANAILDYNEDASNTLKIDFGGIAIGNGCVNNTVQNSEQYISFLHENNLIPSSSNTNNQAVAEAQMIKYIGYVPNYYDYRIGSVSCPACYGYNYTAWSYWFLRNDVKESLNVCGDAGLDAFDGSAGGCINMGAFDSHDSFDYSGALGRALDSNVPVTFYYGKTDTACNYVGGRAMADTISWNGNQQFLQASLDPLLISGVEAGQTKSFGGLTWIQIDSAGHMVPLDQPVASALALDTLLQAAAKNRK